MTPHDRARRDRALAVKTTVFGSIGEEITALTEAIGGLQSTDHPSLVPLHDELMQRLEELKKRQGDHP